MKNLKGFCGKYFSLAAILALSTTITLANETKSYVDTKQNSEEQIEYAETEELTPPSDELNVAVITKRIKAKKSKVYSASKSYVSATNVTDNVNILTSDEMKLQGITTLSQALDSLPGISITSNGGLGQTTNIIMQGLSNKYTLVLIDGVKQNDPSNSSGANLSNILTQNIERIEVIKGAQGGVWGADAVGGVINIITKKAKPGTHASVGVEAGSYKYRSYTTFLSHKTHSYDVMLSALHVKQDGYSVVLPYGDDLDKYENDAYRNTTINLKAGYWINANNRIEFSHQDVNAMAEYDWANDPNKDEKINYREKSTFLTYKYFTRRHEIEATLSQSYSNREEWDLKGKSPAIEIKDTLRYGKDNTLVFGVNYEKRKIEYIKSGENKKANDSSKAIFLNNVYRVNSWVLSQALRYDAFSAYDNKLTGKLGVKYFVNDNLNIYTNIGNGYLAPNMTNMINKWGKPNFDLQPEKSESINIGVKFHDLNINIFRNKIKNMIITDGASWPAPAQYINEKGTSKFKGIEISYQKMFFDKLLLGGNYTYVDAKNANGERLDKRPRYQIGLNASYSVTKKLIINADGTYVGSRAEFGHETGRYFLANANINFQIDKTWSTYFKVNNILDKQYQTVYGYATARRSFYLGVKASF